MRCLPKILAAAATAFVAAQVLTGCASAVATQDEYLKLQNGMSYAEVASIVGDPGKENQHMQMGGIDQKIYIWQNSNGSNLICMFQNDKMINKTATGLP